MAEAGQHGMGMPIPGKGPEGLGEAQMNYYLDLILTCLLAVAINGAVVVFGLAIMRLSGG